MADQNVANFMEITGCKDPAEAKQCLKACENQLERGINHYFSRRSRKRANYDDIQPGPSSSKQVASGVPARHQYSTHNNRVNNADVYTVDLSDDEMDKSVGNGIHQEVSVRAPIQPVQGPIVQQSFQETYGRNSRRGQSNPVFQQFDDFRQIAGEQDAELLVKMRNGKHNAQPEVQEIYAQKSFFVQKTGQNDDIEVQVVKTRKDLSALFRPPIDLMFQGSWENTLLEANQRGLWLLVNIQKADEFACQVLNRDVWSAPTVKEVVSSNFLLWQVYYDSGHGARIQAYYSIEHYPAIFIVDPRIGEEVLKLRATDAVSFLDQVTAFLEKYPSFEARDALLGLSSAKFSAEEEKPSTSYSSSSKKKGKRKAEELCSDKDEEDDETTANFQAKRMRTVVTIKDDDYEEEMQMPAATSTQQNSSPEVETDHWKGLVGEATQNSKPVKLLMRMANSQKELISVLSTTKLEALFAYIAGRQLQPKDHLLVLDFPKRTFSLKEQQKSVRDAGFSDQEVVHIEKM